MQVNVYIQRVVVMTKWHLTLDFMCRTIQKPYQLNLLLENIYTFVKTAEENAEVMLPGMTHLQHAQPINFGYHMIAYASMFKRDYERFMSSYERNNYSPIGCAALAGTPHNISRQITSDKLGFNAPTL